MIRRNDKKTFLNLKKKMLLALIQKIASLGSLNQTDHQLLLPSLLLLLLPDCQLLLCLLLQEKDYYYRQTATSAYFLFWVVSSVFNDSSREFHKVYIDPGKESVMLLCCIEQGLGMGWVRHVIELEKVHQILHIFNMSTH